MINIYEVIFISMKYILNPSQISNLKNFVQKFIDSELDTIKNESDDWGLDMIRELYTLQSVDKIVVDGVNVEQGINIYVTIHTIRYQKKFDEDDYNSLIDEISYKLSLQLPNSDIFIITIF